MWRGNGGPRNPFATLKKENPEREKGYVYVAHTTALPMGLRVGENDARPPCALNFRIAAHEDDSRLTNALLSSLTETKWTRIRVSNELNGPEIFDSDEFVTVQRRVG